MRDSAIFYKTFYDCIKELPEEDGYALYDAVFQYAFYGAEPELSGLCAGIFAMIKVQIDANNKRYENGKKGAEHGKKGGRPKKPEWDILEESKETPEGIEGKKPENPKGVILEETEKTPNDNVNVNDNDNANEKKETPKGVKKKTVSPSSGCKDIAQADIQVILEKWNELCAYGIAPVSRIGRESERYGQLVERINQYSVQDVLAAIDRIKNSDFLQGITSRDGWTATFDWFVRPDIFPRVLEGNYDNRNGGGSNGRTGGNALQNAKDTYTAEFEQMLSG